MVKQMMSTAGNHQASKAFYRIQNGNRNPKKGRKGALVGLLLQHETGEENSTAHRTMLKLERWGIGRKRNTKMHTPSCSDVCEYGGIDARTSRN